jgi:hypothetical protein
MKEHEIVVASSSPATDAAKTRCPFPTRDMPRFAAVRSSAA